MVTTFFRGLAVASTFCLLASVALAQSAYLPLAEGSRWELKSGGQTMVLQVVGRTGPIYHVKWTNPFVATEFEFAYSRTGDQILLTGLDMGSGVAKMPSDTVYFDFGLKQGGSWSDTLGTNTVLRRDLTIRTGAGTFEHCIEIRATDKKKFSTYWAFAPGVGFVQFGEGSGAFVLASYSRGNLSQSIDSSPAPAPLRALPPVQAGASPSGTIYFSLDSNPPPTEGYGPESMHNRFRMAVTAGISYTSFLPKWDELEPSRGTYRFDDLDQRVRLAEEANIPISLNIRMVDGNNRAMASDFKGWRFDDPKMADQLKRLLQAVGPRFHGRVKWISIGNEVDHYFDGHRNEIDSYGRLLDNVMGTVREQFPGALFTVNFSDQRIADLNGRYAPISSKAEFISYNYYPVNPDFTVREPSVAKDEMSAMIRAAGAKRVMFQELGYPSSNHLNSSEEKQARFVQIACQTLRENRSRIIAATFNWMSDLPQSVIDQLGQYYKLANSDKFKEYLGSLGLFDRNGRSKPAWAQLQNDLKNP